MKTGVIGIINNPATSDNSHSAGMNYIVSKIFDAQILNENENWNDYDRLIIYHGVNFKEGSFNIIGGFSNDIFIRIKKLIDFKGEILTLDGFQLVDLIKSRKLYNYNYDKIFNSIKLPNKDKIVIGDSHSISIWPNEEYTISRNDGKTLYGFLKLNLDLSSYKEVMLYFGNIDIRFHLCRQLNPIESTRELVKNYINYAKKYNATVTCLLPIESELRKLPSSGLYKKEKFFGNKELRSNLVDLFNNELLSSGLKVNEWPDDWYTNIDYYEKQIMEPKQSVHIRPKFYQRNIKKQLSLF